MRYLSFLYAFIQLGKKSVVDGSECFKPSRPGVFQFAIFLSGAFCPVRCIFTYGHFSSIRNSVSILLIHLVFCYDFSVHIFCYKILLPLLHLVVDIVAVFYRYCLIFFRYLFSPLSFNGIFCWSPNAFLRSCCRVFSVSSVYFLMIRFRILGCFRSLFISHSCQSSYPGFNSGLQGDPEFLTD